MNGVTGSNTNAGDDSSSVTAAYTDTSVATWNEATITDIEKQPWFQKKVDDKAAEKLRQMLASMNVSSNSTEDIVAQDMEDPESPEPPYIPEFKVILVGDRNVGKKTFVKALMSNDPNDVRHIEKCKARVHRLKFYTNRGPIVFNVWVSYQDRFPGDPCVKGFYATAMCAIVMFDVTSRASFKNVNTMYREVMSKCSADENNNSTFPVVLCGNKVDDVKNRTVNKANITFHEKNGLAYYEVSAKFPETVAVPFLELARQLSGDRKLRFVGQVALQPPIGSNATTHVATPPLPDEDDEGLY